MTTTMTTSTTTWSDHANSERSNKRSWHHEIHETSAFCVLSCSPASAATPIRLSSLVWISVHYWLKAAKIQQNEGFRDSGHFFQRFSVTFSDFCFWNR